MQDIITILLRVTFIPSFFIMRHVRENFLNVKKRDQNRKRQKRLYDCDVRIPSATTRIDRRLSPRTTMTPEISPVKSTHRWRCCCCWWLCWRSQGWQGWTGDNSERKSIDKGLVLMQLCLRLRRYVSFHAHTAASVTEVSLLPSHLLQARKYRHVKQALKGHMFRS